MNHINFTEHLIMGGFDYAYGISTADLTGNGMLDLVAADTNRRYLCNWTGTK
ncbi:MAG: hypothetical protein AAF702_32255 [Chloroflexota bacterium]